MAVKKKQPIEENGQKATPAKIKVKKESSQKLKSSGSPDKTEKSFPTIDIGASVGDLETQILRQVHDSIIATDMEGRITLWNKGAERIFEYTADEAIGQDISLIYFEEDTGLLKDRVVAPVLAKGEHELEVCCRAKSGREVFIHLSLSLLHDENGTPSGMIGYALDIFERKKVEQALQKSEAQLRTIVENLNEGLVVADLDGNLFHWNPAAVAMHGFGSVEECRRKLPEFGEIFELSTEQDGVLPLERWPLARILRGETIHDWEVHIRRLSSDWERIFNYGGTLTKDDQGRPFLAIVTVTDITKRKRIEQMLHRENREIELANRILRIFVEETDDVLYDKALDVVMEGMASRHGVFGYVDEQGDLVCPTMSKMFEKCEMPDKCIRYTKDKWKGLWARALHEKQALYTNDPPRVPAGHVAIQNNMAAPILFQGEVIGLLNLANKTGEYTEEDKILLEGIANRIAPVLYAWIQRKLREDERKLGEEELRKSETRLKLAQALAGAGVWDWDFSTDKLEWSKELFHLFGLDHDKDEACFDIWRNVLHHDDRLLAEKQIETAIKNREPLNSEYRIVLGSGQVRWINARGDTIYNDDSKPERMSGICIDITDRKLAEEQINNLAKFPAENPYPVMRLAEDGTILYSNQPGILFLKEWNREIGGKAPDNWCSLVKESLRSDRMLVEQSRCGDHVFSFAVAPIRESGYVNLYGRDITVQEKIKGALRNHQKQLKEQVRERTAELAQTVAVLQEEVEQRTRAEDSLRERTRDSDAFFSHTIMPLAILDRNFNFVRVNKAYAEACQRDISEFTGRNHFEFYPHEENQRIFEQVVRTKTPYNVLAKPFSFPDHPEWGVTYWDWSLVPVVDEDGEVRLLIFSLKDVTKHEKAEIRKGVTNSLLELFAQKTSRKEYLDSVVKIIRDWSGCECVGIRITNDDGRIPYESCVGFSEEFIMLENNLCLHKDACVCMRVITQTPEPHDAEVVTIKGSFRCGNTYSFVDSLAEEEKKQYRGNCPRAGFASIAVVPIRYRDHILGAIHLADKNKNKVPLETVEFLEDMAYLIGEAVHRFNVEQSLRLNEERLLEAQRIAHLGNWQWDITDNKLWWSDEVYRIFGLRPQQFGATYEAFLSYVHPEDHELVSEAVNKAFNENMPYGIDHRVLRPDGSVRIVHEQAETFRDSEGNPVKMIGTVQDITELRQKEQKLKEGEERFRLLAESIEDVFWMSTPGIKEMIYVSPAYEKIWGRSRESLYNSPCSFIDAAHPDDRRKLMEGLRLHADGVWDFEYRIVRPDGSVCWVRDRGFPIRNKEGNLRLMCGVATDISEHKRAEEKILADRAALRSLASELQLAEESERRRIAVDLHDSIGQILAFSRRELAGLEKTAPDKIAMSLKEVGGQLDKAVRQSRTLSFELSPSVLYDLGLETALEDLAERFSEERKIKCRFKSIGQFGSVEDAVRILLYRSVRELLVNVVKHAGSTEVKITLQRINDDVQINIEDNGNGFDASILDSRSRKSKGFGLFSIRERLSHIDGRFEIQTAKGAGTRITLAAPLSIKASERKD